VNLDDLSQIDSDFEPKSQALGDLTVTAADRTVKVRRRFVTSSVC
jgi:hypothetical protein